jgi:hypothetical protein
MRRRHFIPLSLSSAALLVAVAAMPALAQSQLPRPSQLPPPGGAQQKPAQPLPPPGKPGAQPQQQQQPAAAPPAPYQPVAITAPKPIADPSFDAFRNQIAEIAKRKDKKALAALVSPAFFWMGEKGDRADKKKPMVESLAKAIGLDAKDGSGWEALTGYAADLTGMPFPDKKDVICAPADPEFDAKALEALAQSSKTDASEWGYPMQPGLEARGGPQPNAPVIEKLGMHFVRVLEDNAPPNQQNPMLRIVTPSGKVGFVPGDAIAPLGNDQICYVKEAAGWKIAGFIGGE